MVKEKKRLVGVPNPLGLGTRSQKQKNPEKGVRHFGAAWRPINRPDFSLNQLQSDIQWPYTL